MLKKKTEKKYERGKGIIKKKWRSWHGAAGLVEIPHEPRVLRNVSGAFSLIARTTLFNSLSLLEM